MPHRIIIIDNSSFWKGGTAQVAISSAIELSKRGLDVTYIAADGLDGALLKECGIKVYNLKQYELKENPNRFNAMTNGIWNKSVYKSMSSILSKFDSKDTIIHIHGYLHRFSVSLVKACTDSGIRTVLTLHDYFIVCPSGGFYDYSSNKICSKTPMSLGCITCNCDKRNYFQKIWRVVRQFKINQYVRNNKKLNLIYISDFSYSKIDKYLLRGKKAYYVRNPYDIGDDYKVDASKNNNYVYLGRLSSEKGVDLFCSAFTQLKEENKIMGNAVVYGDGDQRERLEREYPEIQFLGWKKHNEIDEVICSARALVFPSKWYEGSPLTPIEFMSHGVPCISSNACSAIEYINDGLNGLIFESEDIQDLKRKLLVANDAEEWCAISQNLTKDFDRNTYSLDSHILRLLEVYKLILEG